MNSPEEASLIARAQAGDHDAFADLVRRHHLHVLGICRSYLKNEAGADDAAADVFVKAYTSLKRYRGDSAFGTWLYRVAANHCKDVLRSQRRTRSESLEALASEYGLDMPERSSFTDDAENRELAQSILSQLNEDHRTILQLREISGLTYDELAAAIGISLDAVKSRLKRAREAAFEIARHFSASPNVKPGSPL